MLSEAKDEIEAFFSYFEEKNATKAQFSRCAIAQHMNEVIVDSSTRKLNRKNEESQKKARKKERKKKAFQHTNKPVEKGRRKRNAKDLGAGKKQAPQQCLFPQWLPTDEKQMQPMVKGWYFYGAGDERP